MIQETIAIPYKVTIEPAQVTGTIVAPASKSSMQRACAAALVSGGQTRIINPGISNDDNASLGVIQALGAKVTREQDGSLAIDATQAASYGQEDSTSVDFGESGLGIRMFTSIAALKHGIIHINGAGSLLSRPMDFFDEQLPKLGVQITSNEGKLPLEIQGPLVPKDIEIDGSMSSQFLTGMLLAYAAADASDVTIAVKNLKSKPYVDLTLKVMADFGLRVPENRDYKAFYFPSVTDTNTPHKDSIRYQVEGDWSGGAFLLVAGAIAGPITVTGLDIHSTQADKAVLQALADTGCRLSVQEHQIEVGPLGMQGLKAFHFDANECPDLFPPLVALAAYCEGTSVIDGVERLTHKESNRALTLQEEFAKLGVSIKFQDNLMLVEGGKGIKGNTTTHSRHDHRIAMACAVAALKADGPVNIEEAAAVKKSYPNFYQHLQQLGVNLLS